jgi:hypothetical protein
MVDMAPSLTAPAPTIVAAMKGKNMVIPFVIQGIEKTKAPRIRRRAGLSGGTGTALRRFQIIEPIASSKALVVACGD